MEASVTHNGQPLVSVLLPTRARPGPLTASVESLLEKAGDPDEIQICYAVDDDDEATIELLGELARPTDTVWVTPRHGYSGLHQYVNELVPQAVGIWYLLWNDDAIMQTYGWEWEIAKFRPRYVLDCWSNHEPLTCAFPVVPAWWVEAIGHFSLNAHNDTWWQQIGEMTHRLVRVDIDVLHERHDLTGKNYDETYREKVELHQTALFYTTHNINLIKQDAKVIQKLLTRQRDLRLKGGAWECESGGLALDV